MELPKFKTLLLTILFFLIHVQQAFSQYHFFGYYCDQITGNYTKTSAYKKNLDVLLPKLTVQASTELFNNHSVGKGVDKAYGLYLCRGDLNEQQCHDCVDAAIVSIGEKCPVQIETIVWYEECLVRYANRSIFEYEDESLLTYSWSESNVSDAKKFDKIFSLAVDETIMEAAYNETINGFATAETNLSLFETVYIMGICTPDILGSLCERCLRVALSSMAGCCGTSRVNLAMYLPSCWLRYDSAPYIMSDGSVQPPTSPPPPTHKASNWPLPLPPPTKEAVSTGTTLSPLWVCFALWFLMTLGIPNNVMAAL
ncbi:antimicrobial ginkbilobin-2-like protein [Silene latifolia]|uniref:antimicrobial ginkbilobin-2-like protein n=1 Tax=Silene latifolia TaxID=37657 RepID=UPI003D76C9F6